MNNTSTNTKVKNDINKNFNVLGESPNGNDLSNIVIMKNIITPIIINATIVIIVNSGEFIFLSSSNVSGFIKALPVLNETNVFTISSTSNANNKIKQTMNKMLSVKSPVREVVSIILSTNKVEVRANVRKRNVNNNM